MQMAIPQGWPSAGGRWERHRVYDCEEASEGDARGVAAHFVEYGGQEMMMWKSMKKEQQCVKKEDGFGRIQEQSVPNIVTDDIPYKGKRLGLAIRLPCRNVQSIHYY